MSKPNANENSLFEANLSVIQCIQGTNDVDINKSISEEEIILYKLNELHRWQESQQQLSNQLTRCELLKLEKQKLYELLGLSITSDVSQVINNVVEEEEDNDDLHENADEIEGVHPFSDNDDDDDDEQPQRNHFHPTKYLSPKTTAQNSIVQSFNFSSHDVNEYLVETDENPEIPKRPFLKRGEGLKARFKISPDAFRLNNLPKYKFALRKTHAPDKKKSRHSEKRHHHYQQQHHCESIQNNGPSGEGQQNEENKKGLKGSGKTNNRKSSNGFLCAKPVDSLSLKPKRNSLENKKNTGNNNNNKKQFNGK